MNNSLCVCKNKLKIAPERQDKGPHMFSTYIIQENKDISVQTSHFVFYCIPQPLLVSHALLLQDDCRNER